jgi:pimeloyl-ACP methyl ester carboxylesterase
VTSVSCAAVAFVEVRGLRLHYQQWGPADAQAGMVLVHGLGSSCHIWDYVAPHLVRDSAVSGGTTSARARAQAAQSQAADAEPARGAADAEPARGLRVVALDQRGHGQSDQPDSGYDFASVVADLAEFVDAVGLSGPAVFVGHSWGASVVLHFAAAYSDRAAGLALVDGGTGSPGERWTWAEAEQRLRPPDLDGMLWPELRQRLAGNNGAVPISRAEAMGRTVFDVDAEGRVTRRFRIPNHMQVVRALWEQRTAELLPRVQCPLLILPARQATAAPELASAKVAGVARAQELQPKARVRWFEDTVHDVPLQRPEELAAELLDLARQAGLLPALAA